MDCTSYLLINPFPSRERSVCTESFCSGLPKCSWLVISFLCQLCNVNIYQCQVAKADIWFRIVIAYYS